jgi:hypothetical protein
MAPADEGICKDLDSTKKRGEIMLTSIEGVDEGGTTVRERERNRKRERETEKKKIEREIE